MKIGWPPTALNARTGELTRQACSFARAATAQQFIKFIEAGCLVCVFAYICICLYFAWVIVSSFFSRVGFLAAIIKGSVVNLHNTPA